MSLLVCAPASAQVQPPLSGGVLGAIIDGATHSCFERIVLPHFPALLDCEVPGDFLHADAFVSTGRDPIPPPSQFTRQGPPPPVRRQSCTPLYALYSAYLL
jgi:hypothetical protein